VKRHRYAASLAGGSLAVRTVAVLLGRLCSLVGSRRLLRLRLCLFEEGRARLVFIVDGLNEQGAPTPPGKDRKTDGVGPR